MAEEQSEMAIETTTEETKVEGLFAKTAMEVENYSAVEALESLNALMESEGINDFMVGAVLASVQGNKHWKDYGEFESFKHFVVENQGMEYRKAMYLINNYEVYLESGIEWEEVKDIGWSKLKELTPILTPDNAEYWIEKAREFTVLQLNAMVKAHKAGTLESGDMPVDASTLTVMSFKVHADQKINITMAIDKAKLEATTEVATVALEAICNNYLSGEKVKVPSLLDIMKASGITEVITALDAIWPDIDIQMTMPQTEPEEGVSIVG